MSDEELFLHRLDELHRSINSTDEYEVLRASHIIRQLFMDGDRSLFLKVNRDLRMKVMLDLVDLKPPSIPGLPDPAIWCVPDGIDPRVAPLNLPRVTKNLDGFFKTVVAVVDGHQFTIWNLVDFVAHVMGGVHSGEPRTLREEALTKLRDLRIFSDLNVPLVFMRSIGRIILESLWGVKYVLLGLQRFEDSLGLSIHFVLNILPMKSEKENYILDIGIQEDRDRISIFVDGRGELTLRFIDGEGRRHSVRAGIADYAFTFMKPTYLACDVVFLESEVLLSVEAGGWYYVAVFPPKHTTLDSSNLNFVIGSNVLGTSETNIQVMEQVVYSRYLKSTERSDLRNYFTEKMAQGFPALAQFTGNQFSPSTDHPNFP